MVQHHPNCFQWQCPQWGMVLVLDRLDHGKQDLELLKSCVKQLGFDQTSWWMTLGDGSGWSPIGGSAGLDAMVTKHGVDMSSGSMTAPLCIFFRKCASPSSSTILLPLAPNWISKIAREGAPRAVPIKKFLTRGCPGVDPPTFKSGTRNRWRTREQRSGRERCHSFYLGSFQWASFYSCGPKGILRMESSQWV